MRGLSLAGIGNVEQAMLAVRLGRALALMPDEVREARLHLERARELANEAGRYDAEIAGNTGIALSDLGMSMLAARHLEAAVGLTARSPLLHSLYLARQAKTAVRARDPEVAAELMIKLAALAPMVGSPRLHIHLRHVFDATQQWGSVRDVQHARDALREAAGDARTGAHL